MLVENRIQLPRTRVQGSSREIDVSVVGHCSPTAHQIIIEKFNQSILSR